MEALAFNVWRDYVTHMIHTANFNCQESNLSLSVLRSIQDKLPDYFEDEFFKLKEVATILSLQFG